MPKFRHPETGNVIEVEETFAEQVLRRQKYYEEIKDEEPQAKSPRTRKLRVQGKSGTSEKK